MRLLLILLLLVQGLIACKKTSNSTPLDPEKKNLVIRVKPFLKIPHEEFDSLLRIKLLGHALSKELNLPIADPALATIESSDVFKFKSKPYAMAEKDLSEYLENSRRSSQVVLSLEDRIEIHFLPMGISQEKAMQLLGMTDEADAKFYFINDEDKILKKNKTYFFVKGSKKQIKENDIFFFEEQKSLSHEFLNTKLQFSSSQILRLKIKAQSFERERYIELLPGEKKICKFADIEDGTCTECTYRMENSASTFKSTYQNSDLFYLSINLNGKILPLKNLPEVKDKEGNFIITLDFKKLSSDDHTNLEFMTSQPERIFKRVEGFDYALGCKRRSAQRDIEITPDRRYEVHLSISGRDLDF